MQILPFHRRRSRRFFIFLYHKRIGADSASTQRQAAENMVYYCCPATLFPRHAGETENCNAESDRSCHRPGALPPPRFALSKDLGQNFIINPTVCPRMVEAAGIDRGFGVLEIGPGIGVLTRRPRCAPRRWSQSRSTSGCPPFWPRRSLNSTIVQDRPRGCAQDRSRRTDPAGICRSAGGGNRKSAPTTSPARS